MLFFTIFNGVLRPTKWTYFLFIRLNPTQSYKVTGFKRDVIMNFVYYAKFIMYIICLFFCMCA